MEGSPERVNVLIVEERGVVERGERAAVEREEEETKRKAELDALNKEALGVAEFQQTRGKTDDDRLTGCIEKASLMRGSYSPLSCNLAVMRDGSNIQPAPNWHGRGVYTNANDLENIQMRSGNLHLTRTDARSC